MRRYTLPVVLHAIPGMAGLTALPALTGPPGPPPTHVGPYGG